MSDMNCRHSDEWEADTVEIQNMDHPLVIRHPLQQMDPRHGQVPLPDRAHHLALGLRHAHDPAQGSFHDYSRFTQEDAHDGSRLPAHDCADRRDVLAEFDLRKLDIPVP